MTTLQIDMLEKAFPDLYFFTSPGDETLHFAMDDSRKKVAVFGVKGKAMLTVNQLKALYEDIPEIIAELEGRNG